MITRERERRGDGMEGKIVDRTELAAEFARLRAVGKRAVFTNGCFDLVHAGHVRYLREAASLGDLLAVGLNSDASVRQFKGAGRPIVSEGDRAEVMAALEMVDYVVVFGERTAEAIVAELKPDVYVKGGDYLPETLPEARIVEGYGGQVKLVPYHEDLSTSGIIQKIVDTFCGKSRA
jgi:rfaE bifunctional protein nucleotidyltransferase chain/domain